MYCNFWRPEGHLISTVIKFVILCSYSFLAPTYAQDDRASGKRVPTKQVLSPERPVNNDPCVNVDPLLPAPSSRVLSPTQGQQLRLSCQNQARAQVGRTKPETTVVRPNPIVIPTTIPSVSRPSGGNVPPVSSVGSTLPISTSASARPTASTSTGGNSELAGSKSSPTSSGTNSNGQSGEAKMTLGPISGGHSAQGSTTDLQEWDGCDKNAQIQGGYGGGGGDGAQTGGKDQGAGGCGKAMINPQFAAHMKKYFLKCIQDGAKAAGINGVQKVFINHMGVYVDRLTKAGSVSNHAYGRAMDIGTVDLLGSSGNSLGKLDTNVGAYSGQNQQIYDGFMQCWKDSMKEGGQCGGEGTMGALGHTKSSLNADSKGDHDDHIHFSFAQCKGNPYPVGGGK